MSKKPASPPVASLSLADVRHVVQLAHLPVSEEQLAQFHTQIHSVLSYMSTIQQLPTQGVSETSQVTGLTNILREDIVDTDRMFTQEQALANAKRRHKGFIVVNAVLEEQ